MDAVIVSDSRSLSNDGCIPHGFFRRMSEPTAAAFLELVSARRGHFRLESRHHGALWLELDTLFADARP